MNVNYSPRPIDRPLTTFVPIIDDSCQGDETPRLVPGPTLLVGNPLVAIDEMLEKLVFFGHGSARGLGEVQCKWRGSAPDGFDCGTSYLGGRRGSSNIGGPSHAQPDRGDSWRPWCLCWAWITPHLARQKSGAQLDG